MVAMGLMAQLFFKIKERAHSVSIDCNNPPTQLQNTEILIPLIHLEFLTIKS